MHDLAGHLQTLTRDEIRGRLRDFGRKVGGLKLDLIGRLIDHVKELRQSGAGATGDTGDNDRAAAAAQRDQSPDNGDKADGTKTAGEADNLEPIPDLAKLAHDSKDKIVGIPADVKTEDIVKAFVPKIDAETGEWEDAIWRHDLTNKLWRGMGLSSTASPEVIDLALDSGLIVAVNPVYDPMTGKNARYDPNPDNWHYVPSPEAKTDPSAWAEKLRQHIDSKRFTPVVMKTPHEGLNHKDANHFVAKAIAHDPHVHYVMRQLAPILANHAELIKQHEAIEKEFADNKNLNTAYLDELDKLDDDFLKYMQPGQMPFKKVDRGTWMEKHNEYKEKKKAIHAKYDSLAKDAESRKVRLSQLKSQMEQASKEFRGHLVNAMKSHTPIAIDHRVRFPMSYVNINKAHPGYFSTISSERLANVAIEEAHGFVQAITNAIDGISVKYGHAVKTNRGYCHTIPGTNGKAHEIAISYDLANGTDLPDSAERKLKDATRVIVHELGHAIENAKPGVQAACKEFIQYRTQGDPAVKFKEKFPDGTYGDDEKGSKDQFDRAFSEQDAYYIGKEYHSDTEVFSMGLEKLHKDPLTFATKDPEYFAFMIRVLHNTKF